MKRIPVAVCLVVAALPACSSSSDGTSPDASSRMPDSSTPDASEPDAPGPLEAGAEGSASVDASDAGTPVLDCTSAAGQAARWKAMDGAPLAAGSIAGLVFDADGGLTIAQAQAINCPGTSTGSFTDGCGAQLDGVVWGLKQEVQFYYNHASGVVARVIAGAGYTGSATFKSATSTYVMALGTLTKDGAPFSIEWSNASQSHAALTELANAMLATYAPGHAPETDCVASGDCLFVADDGTGTAYFGVRPLNFYATFANTGSVPDGIYEDWNPGYEPNGCGGDAGGQPSSDGGGDASHDAAGE